MSVKSKVKRCNKEIIRLENKIEILEREKRIIENRNLADKELLENILKFAVTNHIGGIHGGMAIDGFGIEKMKDLKLSIEKDLFMRSYIVRVNYY